MDIRALASAAESFGLVLVEAMFARQPVVTTRVGAILTGGKDRNTGYLMEPKAPIDLAKRLLTLINDTSPYQSRGQAGLARARADFSADRYARQSDGLYQRLAEQGIDR